MVKKSRAEIMKLFRKRRLESDPEFRNKENKRLSTLKRNKRAAMTALQLRESREKRRLYMRKWREQRKPKKVERTCIDNEPGFKTPQSLGRALNKMKIHFPKTHKKRLEVIQGLLKEVGLKLKDTEVDSTKQTQMGLSEEEEKTEQINNLDQATSHD